MWTFRYFLRISAVSLARGYVLEMMLSIDIGRNTSPTRSACRRPFSERLPSSPCRICCAFRIVSPWRTKEKRRGRIQSTRPMTASAGSPKGKGDIVRSVYFTRYTYSSTGALAPLEIRFLTGLAQYPWGVYSEGHEIRTRCGEGEGSEAIEDY